MKKKSYQKVNQKGSPNSPTYINSYNQKSSDYVFNQSASEKSEHHYSFFIFCNTASTNGFKIAKDFLEKKNQNVNNFQVNKQNQELFQTIEINDQKSLSEKSESTDDTSTVTSDFENQRDWGRDYVSFELEKFKKEDQQNFIVNIFFVNLNNKESKQKGLRQYKYLQDQNYTNCRTIVSGGDGSIIWVIEEMVKFGIDMKDQALAAIAVGCGNDFCRAFGWGSELSDSLGGSKYTIPILKKLAKQWIQSTIKDLDVWDIEIQTQENGHFNQIKLNENKVPIQNSLKNPDGSIKTNLKSRMVNYFSVGLDAQIGFEFDKHRTHNIIINKFFYFWEGLKKLLSKKMKVENILSSFIEYIKVEDKKPSSAKDLKYQFIKENEKENDEEGQNTKQPYEEKVIFKSDSQKQSQTNQDRTYYSLTGEPINLVCLNIASYCAGAENIWENCRSSGLQNKHKQKIINNGSKFGFQDSGDGKLEFVSFRNILEFIMERFIVGFGSRIDQGHGPYKINFKKGQYQQNGMQNLTYFQIDGEYYEVVAPEYALISQTKDIPNGKVKIMVNKNLEKKVQKKRKKWRKGKIFQ